MSQTGTVTQVAGAPAEATGAGRDSLPLTVIEPRRRIFHIDFAELWRYRELAYFLVWRDVKVRYKQTVLGGAWAILQPFFSMVVFSVIFGGFAKIPSDGIPYPLFVYAGLLPWTFFSNSVSTAGVSLVTQSHLLTKIYFPRLYVPTATIGVTLVDLGFAMLVYVGIMLYYMHPPGWGVLLLPLLLALAVITSAGVGLFLAAVTVTYRDFRHVVPFLLQVWMYASPVVYPISLVPQHYQWLMAANPMVGIIHGFRSALLGAPMRWDLLGLSAAVGCGALFLGLWNFRRTERRFADIA
jgi:lipopolysaccharide transport system permease protein